MFAQISEKASDPVAWADLTKQIGVGGLFGVLILLAVVGGLFLFYRTAFGSNGFIRSAVAALVARGLAFADKLEASIDRLEAAAKGDRQSQEDLRVAGREFARGMTEIAKKIGADVEHEAATIDATLNRSPLGS